MAATQSRAREHTWDEVVLTDALFRAAIAQLGERQTEDLKVPSSILGLGIDMYGVSICCLTIAQDVHAPCTSVSGVCQWSTHTCRASHGSGSCLPLVDVQFSHWPPTMRVGFKSILEVHRQVLRVCLHNIHQQPR